MKIKHIKTTVEELNLTDQTVDEITTNRLKMMLNGGEYIREQDNKTWLKCDDPNWHHGSVFELTIREATELDLAVFKVLDAIRKSTN